jgi:predicted RNA-binding Zn ribbon-like protein
VQDFVNTEIPVWAIDEIATPEALAEWLRDRDLLGRDLSVGADAFVRTRALRALLRELARRNTHGEPVDEALRSEFAAIVQGAGLRFALTTEGDLRAEPARGDADGAIAAILARILDAQAAGVWRRLKSCPGAHCGWLFFDGSRNASSKWCSMSICGNRTKTAAYRRRRSTA